MICRRISRRAFVKTTAQAGAGLFLAMQLPGGSAGARERQETALNAYLHIDTGGIATVLFPKTEMGQGVRTLAALVAAEELELPLDDVRVTVPAPGGDHRNMQTGGSVTARYTFRSLRPHFAAAKHMLIAAAAERWGIPADECYAKLGHIHNTRNAAVLGYGDVAELAAAQPVPASPPLKAREDFRLLGQPQAQLHNRDIVTGAARYGIDEHVEGMLYACLVRSPVVGGDVVDYDDRECRRVPGFVQTAVISGTRINDYPEYVRSAVAVVAEHSWAALQAVEALKVTWRRGANAEFDTAGYMATLAHMTEAPGTVFRDEGSLDEGVEQADGVVEGTYSGPFLAHAPMEPMNSVASVTGHDCEIWSPCHAQGRLLKAAMAITGLDESAIRIHTTLIGGSFGRRLQVDYGIEAVLVSKAIGRPVQLLWSREDDMRFGCFRSPYVQKMTGTVKDGRITGFGQKIACSSVWRLREPEMLTGDLDYTVIMPAKILPYAIPNIRMTQNITDLPVPLTWWRASYPTIQHTVQECWMDELIAAAQGDPFEMRLALLAEDDAPLKFAWQEGWGEDIVDRARLANVLRRLRRESGWSEPKSAGQGRGLACSIYRGTYVAQVVELSVAEGRLTLERVTCVVDCGFALNPDNVLAQIEGGIVFGLTAALYGEITFADGEVEQSNFGDYRLLSFADTPDIRVHIVNSDAEVSGVGEPGCHPTMAATCNAVFDATGMRVRSLPIKAERLA